MQRHDNADGFVAGTSDLGRAKHNRAPRTPRHIEAPIEAPLLERRAPRNKRNPTLAEFGGLHCDLVRQLLERLERDEQLLRSFVKAAWEEAESRVDIHYPWAALAVALKKCREDLQRTGRERRLKQFDLDAAEVFAARGRIYYWSPAETEQLTVAQHFTLIAMGFTENPPIARALRTTVGAVQKSIQRLSKHAHDPNDADADVFAVIERVLEHQGVDLESLRHASEWEAYEVAVRRMVLENAAIDTTSKKSRHA